LIGVSSFFGLGYASFSQAGNDSVCLESAKPSFTANVLLQVLAIVCRQHIEDLAFFSRQSLGDGLINLLSFTLATASLKRKGGENKGFLQNQ